MQTPQQRKANEKFKKAQDAKRGKPASEIKKRENFKSPISPLWLGKSFLFPDHEAISIRRTWFERWGLCRAWFGRGLESWANWAVNRSPRIRGLRRSDIRVAEPVLPSVRS